MGLEHEQVSQAVAVTGVALEGRLQLAASLIDPACMVPAKGWMALRAIELACGSVRTDC